MFSRNPDKPLSVKDASSTPTYSFLPASWVGDAHGETDFLPIGDREETGGTILNRRTDSLRAELVPVARNLADEGSETRGLDC